MSFSTGKNAPPKTASSLEGIGNILAPFLPRCCDALPRVRRNAVNTIGMILYVDYVLGHQAGTDLSPSPALKPLNGIRAHIGNSDQQEQYVACHDLAKVISDVISPQEIEGFFTAMLNTAIRDVEMSGQEAVCVIANTLCKTRGKEIVQAVPEMVNIILGSLGVAKSETVKKGIFSCVRVLAVHHLGQVLQALLDQPMPHNDGVVETLQALAGDKKLYEKFVTKLLFNINNARLHEEKIEKKKTLLIPLDTPMASTCALGEICEAIPEQAIPALLPALLSSVLMRVGTAIDEESKQVPQSAADEQKEKPKTVTVNPESQAINALQSILSACDLKEITEALITSNGWTLMADKERYTEAIAVIADTIAARRRDLLEPLYEYLVPFIKGNYMQQRVVVATIFSVFVGYCKSNHGLLQKLVDALVGALCDAPLKVHILRALGNIANNGCEECNIHSVTVLDVLTSAVEDQCEEISIEAMLSLSKFIEKVDEDKVSMILVNLCHRIRPLFESENVLIRHSAFSLFGSFARCGGKETCNAKFTQQVMEALPNFLTHLYDDDETVRKACKLALRKVSLVVRSEVAANTVIQEAIAAISKERAAYDKHIKETAAKKESEDEDLQDIDELPKVYLFYFFHIEIYIFSIDFNEHILYALIVMI